MCTVPVFGAAVGFIHEMASGDSIEHLLVGEGWITMVMSIAKKSTERITHGVLPSVEISHSTTPKLQTSDFDVEMPSRIV
jgi:hypothetical protein